jgi:hypothetical protein
MCAASLLYIGLFQRWKGGDQQGLGLVVIWPAALRCWLIYGGKTGQHRKQTKAIREDHVYFPLFISENRFFQSLSNPLKHSIFNSVSSLVKIYTSQ